MALLFALVISAAGNSVSAKRSDSSQVTHTVAYRRVFFG